MKKISLVNTFILFSLLSICLAATCRQNSGDQTACNTQGQVEDFTGLDGCQLLIVTEDGKKLLPGRILDSNVTLAAGQRIRFDYRPVEMASICMAEDLIVEITCLQVIDQ